MRYKAACPHDKFDAHWRDNIKTSDDEELWCPGGQLVPADARVVSGESEHCDECGQAYDEVYALPDALWARIHERAPAGLLCPACALNRVVALASVSDPTKAAT